MYLFFVREKVLEVVSLDLIQERWAPAFAQEVVWGKQTPGPVLESCSGGVFVIKEEGWEKVVS